MNPYEIIRRPRISEKSVHLQNTHNTYTFEVDPRANKVQIREAVETLYQVKVRRVNTTHCRGKLRRTRLAVGLTSNWKKALVTLREGQTIEGI
jgi:large subunit ribosomal protein L23